jgi:hypothetical protein
MKKAVFYVLLLSLSLCAEVLVSDDFESGTGNWTLTGNWGLEAGGAVSGNYSLSESPAGNYMSDEVSTATWVTPINLSGSEFATIVFSSKFNLEDGFDFMHFEISSDDGTSWERMRSWTGHTGTEWSQNTIFPISAGYGTVLFRFLFQSDGSLELNGMNIDDFMFYGIPESRETFIHHYGPEFYEGTFYEYESYFECYDLDGIDSVWVEYNADGSWNDLAPANNTALNYYSFTIPFQAPGTKVDYRICVKEASEDHIVTSTDYFTYISGYYKKYDSGVVSYYKDIQEGHAMAIRITPPEPMYYNHLCYALIRNYDDDSDSLGDMKFHVWSDEGGYPGYDLITPFVVSPEVLSGTDNSTFTRIDLRSAEIYVTDDFWIGISGNNMRTLALIESPSEEGTEPYERSYSGTWNGSDWDWAQEPEYNYQFRAVLSGAVYGIEDASIPVSTELYQNYPNPFNPSTEISYSLKSEGMVTLSVFNTKGELVRSLVNEKKPAGNHSVNFNGEGLNSGIYFYGLNVDGNVTGSMRMLLIK